jgi:hypothetical protein
VFFFDRSFSGTDAAFSKNNAKGGGSYLGFKSGGRSAVIAGTPANGKISMGEAPLLF